MNRTSSGAVGNTHARHLRVRPHGWAADLRLSRARPPRWESAVAILVSNNLWSDQLHCRGGIWAFRQRSNVPRTLLLAATAFFFQTLLFAVMHGRELTLQPEWFSIGNSVLMFNGLLTLYAMVPLLWHYPEPLGRFPVGSVVYGLLALLWINETLQFFELPWHAYFLPFTLAVITSPRDATLADTLLALTRRVAGMWQAREEGVRLERARITRDLHDDVAARLLSLLQRVSDVAQQTQVRGVLAALRHVIYALDDQQPITLGDCLNEVQAQLREQLRHSNIQFEWRDPVKTPDVIFSPRTRINLTRVMQEGAANAVHHARPTMLSVHIELAGDMLRIQMVTDGSIRHTEDWSAGKGQHNIRTRMHEVGGGAQWRVRAGEAGRDQTCCLEVTLPWSGQSPS